MKAEEALSLLAELPKDVAIAWLEADLSHRRYRKTWEVVVQLEALGMPDGHQQHWNETLAILAGDSAWCAGVLRSKVAEAEANGYKCGSLLDEVGA